MLASPDLRVFQHGAETLMVFGRSGLVRSVNGVLGGRADLFVDYVKGRLQAQGARACTGSGLGGSLARAGGRERLGCLLDQMEALLRGLGQRDRREVRERVRGLLERLSC